MVHDSKDIDICTILIGDIYFLQAVATIVPQVQSKLQAFPATKPFDTQFVKECDNSNAT